MIFLGAYRAKISAEERRVALASHDDPSAAERELSGVALLELEVVDPNSEFTLTPIHQEGSEWAPYDESYFDATSLKELSGSGPLGFRYRVAFYLHFFVPHRSLITPWGKIASAGIGSVPDHLSRKQYLYWR